MNFKQQKFVDAYLISGNASKAYVEAGYTSKNPDSCAFKLMQNSEVRAAIRQAQHLSTEKATKTKDDLIKDLEEILEVYKISGKFTSHALRAIEQLARLQGLDSPTKIEHTVNPAIVNYIKPGSTTEESKDE